MKDENYIHKKFSFKYFCEKIKHYIFLEDNDLKTMDLN